MSKLLLVWDFDWTLVDENSDPWVVKKIGAWHLFKQYRRCFVFLFCRTILWSCVLVGWKGAYRDLRYSERDIYNACSTIPIHPSLLNIVRRLKEGAGDITSVVISDANSVFIENILEHYACRDSFSEIFTNPALYESSGALRVDPYVTEPHGCPLCPRNLCKGQVMETLLERRLHHKVIYIGDGGGDYCPCTRLKHPDAVFARRRYPDRDGMASLLSKLHKNDAFRICTQPFQSDNTTDSGYASTVDVYPWDNQTELASMVEHALDHCS